MLGRKSTNRTLGIGSKPTADCLLPKSSERGFSLVEALLATSVFALGITGLAGSLIVGQQASVNAGSRARATDLAIEGIESVRNIRDEAFNELRFNQSGVDDSSNEWVFSGEGTTETIDNFTRTISFADVCRDSNNEIVACPGDFTDPHTKQITSTVDWAPRPGATASVSRTTYLTNWETYTWTQTDWSGGAGQAIWSDPAQYDTDNGNIDTSSSGQISLAQNGSNVFFVDDEETEFNQGSHSDTTYNIGNSALELDSTGIAAGAGTFTSRIFDSGNASTAWDDISWVEDLGPRGELRMEAGVTTATNSFSVVTLTQNYDSPVVIPIYYESANTEPVSVRLRNVTGSSFEVRLQRPDGGTAVADTVHYLVIEEGAHILPDGRQLEAHLHTTSTVGSKSGGWSSDAISYSHSYSAAPAVFHQVQTNNDSSWIESWVRSPLSRTNPPTSTGFNLALNGAEAITSHGSETIGWLAIETGAGTLNGVDYEVTYTSDSVLGHANGCYSQSFTNSYASNPIVVADQEEMDGGDGSWAVMCGLSTAAVSVHAEEDTVGDTDRSHTTETFAFMAWEEAFSFKALDLTLQVRSCDDAACSGEVFVGPDGTSGTVFTTPGGEALNLPDNRYVQYQVVLTTTDGVFTPQLTQVTIAGTAPEVTWWDTNYGYRTKVTFGTSHSALPLYYTAAVAMDTRTSATNVELGSGNDIRVVWEPNVGSPVELDRLGDTWDNASTTIRFRLQSAIAANNDEDVDGSYYIYYGNASAGTPPTNEANVYYFADFFNRANSSTIGNGWTEWTTGGGNMSINSNSLSVVGGSEDAPDTGIKQTFGLGAITSNFNLEFDWIMPSNGESQWIHYVNIGSTSMSNSNRTSNVGLGIYYGESGDYFSPNGTENISNDLTGNMENNVSGGPFTIRLEVDTAANDYDYYRDGILRAAGQNWVNSGASMSQIRIATEKYSSAAFTYDNLRIYLTVAASPTIASSSEESQIGTVESGYPSDNFSMSGNKGLWHLDEASGTITDSSGLGNDGTLSGGSYGAAGRLATALDFNGTSDFVAVPDSASLDITNNLTVSFWVYADTTPQLWDSPIIKTTDDDSWYDGFGMFYQGGQIRFWVDQYDTNVASAAFSVGSWHHVVGTYDGTTVRVYVDGVEGTPDSYTGSITPNNTSLFIGSGADASGAGYYWDGKIDEVAVFDRAIDSSEVQALYKRGALNLRYQVRSCDDLACSGESFIGPDGTGSSYYSEITNTALTPPDQVLTNVADNRFFQYQVVLETLDSALSPELKSVTIGYSGGGFVGFSLSGSLVSSAFDMGDVSPVQIIEWDETIPSCSPSCSVQFQLRTAPDASGSPGTWTNWYGATGMGTYFTSANGTRIPVELNGNQWLQYRVELAGDGAETPVLEEIRTFYR